MVYRAPEIHIFTINVVRKNPNYFFKLMVDLVKNKIPLISHL